MYYLFLFRHLLYFDTGTFQEHYISYVYVQVKTQFHIIWSQTFNQIIVNKLGASGAPPDSINK